MTPCATDLALFEDDTRQAEAVRVCHTCPQELACRARVLTMEAAGTPVFGVAGGLLPEERPSGWRADGVRRHPPVTESRRVYAPCRTDAAKKRHRRKGEQCAECDAWTAPEAQATRRQRERIERMDGLAVDATVMGHRQILTRDEQHEAIRALTSQGLSGNEIAVRLGVHRRTVVRARQTHVPPQAGDSYVDEACDNERSDSSSQQRTA